MNKIILFLIFFSGLLVIDPFLHGGIFTAHDMISNLINLGSFYSSLSEGNIIPRWAGNIANLYGSPTMIFYYPLSYYFGSFIRTFGFSLIDTMKIYIFISFILSSLTMYYWLKNHVSKTAAMLGSLLYVYAPYRITDIYARGSIQENTAFIFIPLIAYFIYKLWKDQKLKWVILLSLAIAGLILSHPFMLVIFSPFFIFYFFYLGFDFKKVTYFCLSVFLSIGLTAYYIAPLIIENKYTHYDMSPFKGKEYASQFLNITKLLIPNWTFIDVYGNKEYQTYQIGLVQIILLITSLVLVLIKSKGKFKGIIAKSNGLFFVGLLTFTIALILTLPISDQIYKIFPFLSSIQYPWRFLSLIVFSIALITSITLSRLSGWVLKLSGLLIIISLLSYLPHATGHIYHYFPDTYYLNNIEINVDAFVTLPRWAAQPDKYPRITSRYEIIEGDMTVTTLGRTSTSHTYDITAKTDSRFADSTFYFPGWKVFIDSKPVEIQFQDPSYRGIITFKIPNGRHFIEVVFKNTKVRLIADLISLVSLVSIFIFYLNENKFQKIINRYTGI